MLRRVLRHNASIVGAVLWATVWATAWAAVASAQSASAPVFREVAAETGLRFEHVNGMTGKLYFAEHMGPGVAVLDYDNDGDLDVFVGQGGSFEPPIPGAGVKVAPSDVRDALFRNDLERSAAGGIALRFTDVTASAKLDSTGYNMGVAAADYDNDGFVDLYVANLGSNQLWRNNGDGTFSDRTAQARADDSRWTVATSFFDYDRDGWLDLFLGNYVEFRLATHKNCASPTGSLDYCGPKAYPAEPNRLLRNRAGVFEDTTSPAGLDLPGAATLGSIAADLNEDGWPDLYVANDQMPNQMWINNRQGGFADEAAVSGTAVDGKGQPQASMGVLAEDFDDDGRVDLFLTHLHRELNTLYLNEGDGLFRDASRPSGLGDPSFLFTGFGVVMIDTDPDGRRDLYIVNGAVRRIQEQLEAGDPHPLRQTAQLFRALGGGRFVEVAQPEIEQPTREEVGRALAAADLDNDGDLDLIATHNAGPVRLLLNQTNPERWIGLSLRDEAGRRTLLGAEAVLIAGDQRWLRRSHTDGSYAAAGDSRVLWVIPDGMKPESIEIDWPDGSREKIAVPAMGAYTEVRRSKPVKVERP